MKIIQRFLTKNPYYQENVRRSDFRYREFQERGPSGLMLHSVGCAQPSAEVFCDLWDREDYNAACVHAFIDANTGAVWQTLPWNYRAPHCKGSGNNTHIGVEMCESGAIRYRTDKPWLFDVLDYDKGRKDCRTAYNAAVELFADLCNQFKLDPLRDICSHKEGAARGITSDHGDPEHYWDGLGMGYTMNGFRLDVKKKMEESKMPTKEELEELVNARIDAEFEKRFSKMFDLAYSAKMKALSDNDAGQWSEDARSWFVETGIIKGVGTGKDGKPNYAWEQPLTREQYATMEYRQYLNGGCKINE